MSDFNDLCEELLKACKAIDEQLKELRRFEDNEEETEVTDVKKD